jgi:hypothetical protein
MRPQNELRALLTLALLNVFALVILHCLSASGGLQVEPTPIRQPRNKASPYWVISLIKLAVSLIFLGTASNNLTFFLHLSTFFTDLVLFILVDIGYTAADP